MGEENSRLLEAGNIDPPVPAPDTDTPKWYQDVSLEDAEIYIEANLKSAVRSVIAVGYYLKCVRDGELYRDAGYENIWDYARERFGFSKSTASRYMARNDRFSKDGNSPVLDERYSAFNKSQLQEMLGLGEEQLEQVTPDMTVQEIRAMKKPREIPYVEIPGQGSLEEYPGFYPEEMLGEETEGPEDPGEPAGAVRPLASTGVHAVTAEDLIGAEDGEEAQSPGVAISQQPEDAEKMAAEPLSAYGTPKRVYPPDSPITTEGCEGGHDCFTCAMDCRIRGEERYCREAPLGNPFPCEVVKGDFTALPEGCQFVDHDLAYHCAGDGEPDPCCKNCPDPCEYICGRAMKALGQETVISESDQESTKEYWNPDEEGPDESYNLGDFPQAKDKYLDELAQMMADYMGNRMITFGGLSHMQDEVIQEKLRIFAYKSGGEIQMSEGVITYPCEEYIEFIRGDEDLGISSFHRFANHVRKVMENWTPQISESADDTDLELVNKMLEKEKRNLDEMEKVHQAEPDPTLEKLIRKKRLLVRALEGLLGEMDHPEKEKPEQPDFPVLKNNDQRKEWLNTYHDWPVWFEVPEAAEVYYRYDLSDGSSLVICEYHYWAEWQIHYGNDPERTGTREYMLVPGYHYLEDCKTNRTAMIDKLKEIQKR